jgi:hypothetical protein
MDSSVTVLIRLGPGRPGFDSRQSGIFLLAVTQRSTGSEAHLHSYPLPDLHLVPRLRSCGSIYPLPLRLLIVAFKKASGQLYLYLVLERILPLQSRSILHLYKIPGKPTEFTAILAEIVKLLMYVKNWRYCNSKLWCTDEYLRPRGLCTFS